MPQLRSKEKVTDFSHEKSFRSYLLISITLKNLDYANVTMMMNKELLLNKIQAK